MNPTYSEAEHGKGKGHGNDGVNGEDISFKSAVKRGELGDERRDVTDTSHVRPDSKNANNLEQHHQQEGGTIAALPPSSTAAEKNNVVGYDSTASTGGGGGRDGGSGSGRSDVGVDPHVTIKSRDTTRQGGQTLEGRGGEEPRHRQQDQQTATVVQQEQDQQPSVSPRAMVPDKEDDDGGPGGTAPPRKLILQNYASRDSGAVMLESSPGSKGMGNLLMDSKDKYAISPCEDKQWAVLGLSEDILVRTIRVSSHEKYSSLVKKFQVLASQTYPVDEWLNLGTFTAKFVEGEQIFDMPQPAFARYLKFKFLSHYGDEFYCTVSQIKVHGSTMLESFQHEWQQSSAEVREVQDFMMKNDPKPSAPAGSTNGGAGVPIATDATVAPATTFSPSEAPQSQTSVDPGAPAISSNDPGVDHRPHAASAATVPPGGKRPGVISVGGAAGSGGGGCGTATVEDIVRGVPAEMVVPASSVTCVGPTGSDGTCRGEVLAADGAGSGAGTGGVSLTLGVEIPTMGGGGGGALAKPDDTKEAHGSVEGTAVESNGGYDVGANVNAGALDYGLPAGNGEAAGGMEKKDGAQTSVCGERSSCAHPAGNGEDTLLNGAGAEIPGVSNESGTTKVEGAVGEAQQTQAKEEDPPPRKGIISSTIEAISKATQWGSDGRKPIDNGAKGKGTLDSPDANGHVALPDDSLKGEEGPGGKGSSLPPPPGSMSAAHGQAVDDSSVGESVDALVGSDSGAIHTAGAAGIADPTVAGENTSDVGHQSTATDTSEGQDESGTVPGPGHAAGIIPSTYGLDGENREQKGAAESQGAGDGASGAEPRRPDGFDESRPNRGSLSSGTQAGNTAKVNTTGLDMGAGNSEQAGSTLDPTMGAGVDHAEGRKHPPPAGSAPSDSPKANSINEKLGHHQQNGQTSMTDGAGGSHLHEAAGIVEDGSMSQPDASAAFSAAPGAEQIEESLVHAEGMNAAALAAACLDRLSFTEFREEVLARTQQAQQSAGGGVAISGQYESIFKTLMNKIKTLEINQSLFSLYIDDVHGCYQDVIAQMLQEQERARASRSELLSAQAAHLRRIGDQWPAFQELQAKVVEVENRMLLSSMAWFTSLLCLLIMVCSCCFKICRRCAFSGSSRRSSFSAGSRGRGGKDGRGHADHNEWSPACGAAPTGAGTATTAFQSGTPGRAAAMEWQADDGRRRETSNAGTCFCGGRSGEDSATRIDLSKWAAAERVPAEGGARLNSPKLSRF